MKNYSKNAAEISPAGLLMAAGVSLSCFCFMLAPAGNDAAHFMALFGLILFTGLFFILKKSNL